ncbi:hypothetical protein [Aequorivita sp. CIP111184]|nr:hypothetical protein [Aequorivita sp. CIP111184]SRX55712.1 hypothetical protein AEQU1_02736 [Aequorivita sp. CIP111184]
MNDTLKNVTKLRICGMLSEAARLEVEERIVQAHKIEPSENLNQLNFS